MSRAFAQEKPLDWAGRRHGKKGTRRPEDKAGPRVCADPPRPGWRWGVASDWLTIVWGENNEGLCIPGAFSGL